MVGQNCPDGEWSRGKGGGGCLPCHLSFLFSKNKGPLCFGLVLNVLSIASGFRSFNMDE